MSTSCTQPIHPSVVAHPTRASLEAATEDVAGFYLGRTWYPNSNGNHVARVGELTEPTESVLESESESFNVTLADLLGAVIVDGFQGLRLPDGRILKIVPTTYAHFAPMLGGAHDS